MLWDQIAAYYSKDDSAQKVDTDLLKVGLEQALPKHADMLAGVVDSFTDTSVSNVIQAVLDQKTERNARELGQALAVGEKSKISKLWEERELLLLGELGSDTSSEIIIAPDLNDLFAMRQQENRLSFTPPQLNDALEGGALPGHHILIFGVTDLGKTLLVLDEIRHWIAQGKKVLYICNEDPMSDLVERMLVSITGRDKWAVRKYYQKAEALAMKKGWDNLIWAPLAPGTPSEIEALVNKYNPDIVVADQVRNIDTGDHDLVRRLESGAIFMRNLAKRYGLVSVSVAQGADSADGRAVLQRGDVDNSNVGLPGATDLMLGIGATQEMEMNGTRCLSFCKNKVSGQKTPVTVFFNTKIMRME